MNAVGNDTLYGRYSQIGTRNAAIKNWELWPSGFGLELVRTDRAMLPNGIHGGQQRLLANGYLESTGRNEEKCLF